MIIKLNILEYSRNNKIVSIKNSMILYLLKTKNVKFVYFYLHLSCVKNKREYNFYRPKTNIQVLNFLRCFPSQKAQNKNKNKLLHQDHKCS